MRKILIVVMSILILGLAGCGGEVTVTVPLPIHIITAPSIASYQFSQDRINYLVEGSVDYYAPDVDIDTITISATNSNGVVTNMTVTSLTNTIGSSGSIAFSIDYYSYSPDTYTFTVYLTDKLGYISNPVYGTFRL